MEIIGVREIKDTFFSRAEGRAQVGVKKREKGRVPQPIFIYVARVKAWAKKNL
jgi:hypothetical protein